MAFFSTNVVWPNQAGASGEHSHYICIMVFLTRRERFCAAHQLYREQWDEQKNADVFGKCRNVHGHNFELFVTVKGKPDDETGFIINAKTLGKLIRESVIERLDHSLLNDHKDLLEGKQPTTEVMAMVIWKILQEKLSGCALHCVKLVETENIYVEYYGG